MNRQDKDTIKQKIPYKYQPIGAWKIFFLRLLWSIPVVGQIFLIAHSIGGANIARRSLARSFWIAIIIALILAIAGIVTAIVLVGGFEKFKELIMEYYNQIVNSFKK